MGEIVARQRTVYRAPTAGRDFLTARSAAKKEADALLKKKYPTERAHLDDQNARQASAFRPGKESAKPVRASLGATDQSAAVVREHQPCELFPIASA